MVKTKSSGNKFNNISIKDIWDAENIYHLKTDKSRITRLIYHYEIYKKIKNIKGHVIECGVFKGSSLIRFLTFRSILEKQNSRRIIGFDIFGKFPQQNNISDKDFIKSWEEESGNGISKKELDANLKTKGFKNYDLIKGDINKTIPDYFKNNKIKIALLHIDLDVYEPTKFALNFLKKYMSPKGIILLDDYKDVIGATKATNEFLENNKGYKIEKFNFAEKPYFIVVPK